MHLAPLTTHVLPLALPKITAKPVLRPNLMERDVGNWVEVCPTPGATTGCDYIAIHDVVAEPNGGHYIPACDSNNDCQYIGYVEPNSTIVGSTSYQLHTSKGKSYIVPVPIVLPPGEPVPLPPPLPEGDTPDAPDDPSLTQKSTIPSKTTVSSLKTSTNHSHTAISSLEPSIASAIRCSDTATTIVSVSRDYDWFTSGIVQW